MSLEINQTVYYLSPFFHDGRTIPLLRAATLKALTDDEATLERQTTSAEVLANQESLIGKVPKVARAQAMRATVTVPIDRVMLEDQVQEMLCEYAEEAAVAETVGNCADVKTALEAEPSIRYGCPIPANSLAINGAAVIVAHRA